MPGEYHAVRRRDGQWGRPNSPEIYASIDTRSHRVPSDGPVQLDQVEAVTVCLRGRGPLRGPENRATRWIA